MDVQTLPTTQTPVLVRTASAPTHAVHSPFETLDGRTARLPKYVKDAIHAGVHDMIICFARTGKQVLIQYDHYEPAPVAANKESQSDLYLNPAQRNMYRMVMYGLSEFDKETLAFLSPRTRRSIDAVHRKAMGVIQRLKYTKCFGVFDAQINHLFDHIGGMGKGKLTLAPNAALGSRDSDVHQVPRNATLRKLGITTREVIDTFIAQGLLPQDFYTVNPTDLKL